jgi:predicted dienelactone hydrolase
MNGFLRGSLLVALSGIALVGCGGGGGDDSNSPGVLAPTAVVQPLDARKGLYAVACSNIVQDFSRVGAGEDVTSYWEGMPDNDRPRYVTDLLADPGNTLIATVPAILTQDSDLYGDFAGKPWEFVVIVCYPTTRDNPRPDYPLNPPQTDRFVPHMQTGDEAPIFADESARYPVVAFSHGYMGSPISSDDYMLALRVCASYGYVVIAPFHGDLRFSNLKIDDLKGAVEFAKDFAEELDNFTAMQALRPLAISAALGLVVNHSQWKDHIDKDLIGGFGASMGGETMLLLAGAGLTTSYLNMGGSMKPVTLDPLNPRIKAAVGYVPWFGLLQLSYFGEQELLLPAFGRDQDGLEGINMPFLGISGTADTTAPIEAVEIGMRRLTGTRRLVALEGVEHGFDDAFTNDIFTWALTFLDAKVLETQKAISLLNTMGSVDGGGNDSLWLY